MIENQEPFAPEEPPRRQRGCIFTLLILGTLVALLFSSVASLYWFFTTRNGVASSQQQSLAETIKVPPETTPIRELTPRSEPTDLPAATATQMMVDSDQPIAASEGLLNRITFIDNEGQVNTIAPDGNDQRTLTSDANTYQFPAWSPDGEHIAVVGSSLTGGGIYLLEDSEELTDAQEIYFSRTEGPFYLYWSPNNESVAFLATNSGNSLGLNIVPAEQEQASRQIATGSPLYWNWTAEGDQLLLHVGNRVVDDARLVMVDSVGRDTAPQIPLPGFFQAPGISQSGAFWAYSQLQGDNNSWLVIDEVETGEQITNRHGGSLALSWSPATDQLAYISGDATRIGSWGPLRVVDALTGDIQTLSEDIVMAFFWSPDGKKIATLSIPRNTPLDGQNASIIKDRRLVKNTDPLQMIQSGEGQILLTVIDVATGSGLEITKFRPTNLFLGQLLPFFDQYALSHQIWSPASDALVLPANVNGRNKIMVYSTNSGRMRDIADGSIAFWSQQ